MRRARWMALTMLPLACAGCGLLLDETQPPTGFDAGPARDAGERDGGPDAAATDGGATDGGATDAGRPCVEGTACTLVEDVLAICVDGVCVPSVCGDGVHDRRTEECDDGDDDDADGCTAACEAGCVEDDACLPPDGPCVLGGSCVDGRCAVEHADDDTPCANGAGEAGACLDGRCVPFTCGDGALDPGETCDDGNRTSGDGCELDCTWSCTEPSDCDDGIYCNGTETCVEIATGRRCSTAAPPLCPMPARCDFVCDLASDTCVPGDLDADGVDCLVDCHDGDDSVGGPSVDCWPDDDDDGHGAMVAPERRCACLAGEVAVSGDCDDEAPRVNPEADFSAAPRTTSDGASTYDWNCDGNIELEHAGSSTITDCPRDGDERCAASTFWQGTSTPGCGDPGVLVTCVAAYGACRTETPDVRQRCR